MSDHQGKYPHSVEQSKEIDLFVCLFSTQQQINDSVSQLLNGDRYSLKCFDVAEDLEKFIFANNKQIDCLILAVSDELGSVMNRLWQEQVLLPAVIIEAQPNSTTASSETDSVPVCDLATRNIYHRAELHLYPTQLAEIHSYLNLAITRFISLTPNSPIGGRSSLNRDLPEEVRQSLVMQQRRLTGKIRDKLGYLGVYYKRDLAAFYSNLPAEKQQELKQKLSSSYRQIAIEYFSDNSQVDWSIEQFVDLAFFANISTSLVLEIHMELIDDFSQQLKIEGRSEDILLDYRLPLIDVIAHLCEMYRRSIAEKDLSLELLFAVE